MEIYIHRVTKKGWILIREIGAEIGEFVSPSSRIMERPFSDFNFAQEEDYNSPIEKETLLRKQVEKYEKHKEFRQEELWDNVEISIKEMMDENGPEYTISFLKRELRKLDANAIKES